MKKKFSLQRIVKERPYLFFTFLFCITCLGCFIWFPLAKKGFIWIGETKDGLVQHYNALMYYGRYLRYILTHFEIPLWDFSFGYGADVLTTLHYYTIGDPLNLLSVFVPARYTEYLYICLILLRYYLAGCAFIFYCQVMKKENAWSVIGALVYVFCGFALVAGVRHPYFLNPMIYLPLVLSGVEKIYRHQSPTLFIVMVCISALSNFYFFYMIVVLTVIYAIFRFFDYHHEHYLKNIINSLIKFILYGLVAVMMAGVILIPVILLFVNTSRSQVSTYIPTFYSPQYYIKLLFGGTSSISNSYWSYKSFAGITVICWILLMIDKHQKLSLKLGWLFLTLGLCLPFFGSMMNGFSYVTNRWIFGYALFISFVVVCTLPSLFHLTLKQFILLLIGVVLYCGIGFCFTELKQMSFYVLCVILAFIMLVTILYSFLYRQGHQKIAKSMMYISLVAIVIINVCVNAKLRYNDDNGTHYVNQFLTLKQGYNQLLENRHTLIKNLNDSDFYRIDEYSGGKKWLRNASLQLQQSSLAFFYSLGSGYTSQYFEEMQNINALSSSYTGVNYRTFLESLASTKYFISPKNVKSIIPYGYQKLDIDSEDFDVYENQNALPLGYTYSSSITQEEYEALTPLQRQEALLQSVYIQDLITTYSTKELDFTSKLVDTKIEEQFLDKNGFSITKEKQKMKILLSDAPAGELYLHLSGKFSSNEEKITKTSVKVYKGDSKFSQNIVFRTPYNPYYANTTEYLLNLGYSENQPKEITIEFTNIGQYHFKDIEVYVQPMLKYSQHIDELCENTLENINISTNRINGDIYVDKKKFLCLSIPYSQGWEAYVDGDKVNLYNANVMYMGIDLSEGHHHIELIYKTPGLKIGLCVSLGGWLIFFDILYLQRKKIKHSSHV